MRSIRSSRRSAAFLVAAAVVVAPLTVGSAAGAAAPERVHAQASGGPSSGEVLATLKVTSGNVSVRKDGKKKFKPATDGQALRQGDTIKTDATGTAEVDYGNDAFTRLDVNTTFTIVVLTDEQGARQVQGSLESGQTWNRTAALTESGSFEQEGAGANATVRGTAFSILCDTVDHCTFTAVVDDIDLTGLDGVTRLLTPLTQCESNDTSENGEVRDLTGVLCGDITQIAPDQIPAWILQNLIKDLALGLPDGGILTGTIVVTDTGAVVFVPTPAPPSSGSTVVQPPVVDGILVPDVCGGDTVTLCSTASTTAIPPGWTQPDPSDAITVFCAYFGCGYELFRVYVVSPADLTGVSVVFTGLPENGDIGYDCVDEEDLECLGWLTEDDIAGATQFGAATVFAFDPSDWYFEGEASDVQPASTTESSFTFVAVNAGGSSAEEEITTVVEEFDCGGFEEVESADC